MDIAIKNIRLKNHQLVSPQQHSPKEFVSWMGAVQAQNYTMAKWAIAIRLTSCSESEVEEAFNRGDILRTHIMRPTWHFVASEDIRWLIALTEDHVKAACNSFIKKIQPSPKEYNKYCKLLERNLANNNYLTKQEIATLVAQEGIVIISDKINLFLIQAEAEGLICSGTLKNNKPTYALLEERVPFKKTIHRDESLAKLALKYMKSHSPASLQDFVWWSGLTIREVRKAIGFIEDELIKDHFQSEELYIHTTYKDSPSLDNNIVHLLPSYDEYLISYKNRTHVLNIEHHSKAFNKNGIFQPIILYNGHGVGNWKKDKNDNFEISFWDDSFKIDEEALLKAKEKLKAYSQDKE